MDSASRKNILEQLFALDVVKFGDFVLKTGIKSPIYVSFRDTIGDPEVLAELGNLLTAALENIDGSQASRICGVPYGALSLATLVAVNLKRPLLICRKEGAKTYGAKKAIEGCFSSGDKCIVIDDVLTSGTSILEIVYTLRREGVVVEHALVMLDRRQGGEENLQQHGIRVHSVFNLPDIIDEYVKMELISRTSADAVSDFLRDAGRTAVVLPSKTMHIELPFVERFAKVKSGVGRKLADIIGEKQSNLCLSADVEHFSAVLDIGDRFGPLICVLKVHCDSIRDFPENGGRILAEVAAQHGYLLFEDRKFADIGNTVMGQYQWGVKSVEWANMVTAHGIAGPGTVEGLRQAYASRAAGGDGPDAILHPRGVLMVAEMSTEGNLATGKYTEGVKEIAQKFDDFVAGFVCQSPLDGDPEFVYFMPGVKLEEGTDSLGQIYKTPETAVAAGADVIIVGRGILQAKPEDQLSVARAYRDRGFAALVRRGKK